MDAQEDVLSHDHIHRIDLGEGCGVGGLLIDGLPCWVAWTPDGIMGRLFATRWTALAAVAHVMDLGWLKVTEAQLRSMDRAYQYKAARIEIAEVALSGSDMRVRCLELRLRGRTIYLHMVAGSGLHDTVVHARELAQVVGAEILSDLPPLDPAHGGGGSFGR